jgi:hypothetical protein
MKLSGLERLGRVAGLAGISVGAVVLLLNALIGTIPDVPPDQRADLVRLLAILSFGIGIVGIVAWFASRRVAGGTVATAGLQSPAIQAKRNVDIDYAGDAPARPGVPGSRPAVRLQSGAAVQTVGDQSPAVAAEGDVSVQYGASTMPGAARKPTRGGARRPHPNRQCCAVGSKPPVPKAPRSLPAAP